MKRLLAIIAGIFFVGNFALADESVMKKVYINQIVDHPALDITVKGIIDGLAEAGYVKGNNLDIRVESAQGNIALAAQISTKFVNQGADVTVGVATPSAQSLVKAAMEGKTKMVFSSVTDPVGANIVTSIEGSNTNVTGMSNSVDVGPQIDMFKQFVPNLKKLGFIYNPSEANSIIQLGEVEEAADSRNVTVVRQAVNRTADVPQAATRLASRTDAIFIYGDNTALAALESIVMAANKAGIPVFVGDTDAVVFGPLAALGPNQYELGINTAKMIARILNGEDINSIPVGFPEKMELYINLDTAEKLSMDVPQELLDNAAKLIEKEK